MNIVIAFVIVFLSISVGVLAVRWHDADKAKAVWVEYQRAEYWRTECERLRDAWIVNGVSIKHYDTALTDSWVCVNGQEENYAATKADNDFVHVTPPIVFGSEEERELASNGCFVRIFQN